MEINDLADRLTHHETRSQHRFEQLHHAIEGKKMADTPHVKNVFSPVENPLGMAGYGGLGGAGAGAGAGLGAGLLGGILGGALLGNRGLFGANGEGVRNHVTPEQLTSALAGVQDNQQNSMVLQDLGEIKAAVPIAEGQVQLALSQAQNALSNQIGQQSISLVQGFSGVNQSIAVAQAAAVAASEAAKDAVNNTAAATQLAIANNTAQGLVNTNAIITATTNSTKEILGAINAQNVANLQRELTVAELRNAEDRAEARSRAVEVNVSQSVAQNQNQLNLQNQQQAQLQVLANLAAGVNNLANDIQAVRQTQSQVVFGNNIGSGQAANATNNSVR